MPSTEPLSRDDLDEIGQSSFHLDDPLQAASRLLEVVERAQLADRADAGYALLQAAEIFERAGELEVAEQVAGHAVAAYRAFGDPEDGFPRAYRAELLLRLGREPAAMTELLALRPLLTRDPVAVTYISEALEMGGQAEVAVQWLTDAVELALSADQGCGRVDLGGTAGGDQAALLAYTLTQQRRRLRRDLGLPADAYDALADQLRDGLHQALDEEDPEEENPGERYVGTAVLFWPKGEFERLLAWQPRLAEPFGRTWEEHRTKLERALTRYLDAGHTGLALLSGVTDELVRYVARTGCDPLEVEARQRFLEETEEFLVETPWPPGRNEPCWCGSQHRYKRCCLARARF